jgi:hypothetical protein
MESSRIRTLSFEGHEEAGELLPSKRDTHPHPDYGLIPQVLRDEVIERPVDIAGHSYLSNASLHVF